MTAPGRPGGRLVVAGVQCDIAWQDRRANLERCGREVAAAADAGAQLVLLPEMFPTGFSMDTDVVAEGPDAATATFLRSQAESRGIHVGGSFACRAPESPLPVNRFLLAGPHGESTVYDKVHPFSYGHEHEHYSPGSRVVSAVIDGVRVTPFICYDLRFADSFWAAAPTTDCYLVVASWPAARQEHWRTLLLARAIENQAYVVGVNRTGTGGGIDYRGGSMVVEPFGGVVADAGSGEKLIVTEVDVRRVRDVRRRYPFLADR
ncbi:MAG TPA: nitrilase-related carbon-nitrogen hydrolase [Acidimicrobiales bacterium]|nr:nitrilase-related carbon-nitrogen hydrolase [Acidimicrobiales bacterium]